MNIKENEEFRYKMHDAKYAENFRFEKEKHLNMIFFFLVKIQQKMNIIQSGTALLFENKTFNLITDHTQKLKTSKLENPSDAFQIHIHSCS